MPQTAVNDQLCIKHPKECTPSERKAFHNLVLKGGQVNPDGLLTRIENAKFIGFYFVDDALVSVIAIKNTKPSRIKKYFQDAGVENQAKNYQIELGWAVTKEGYGGKGFCKSLTTRILSMNGIDNVFATTASDNRGMQAILNQVGFKQIGCEFQGERNSSLRLYVLNK